MDLGVVRGKGTKTHSMNILNYQKMEILFKRGVKEVKYL